jgi:aminoglycoside phosphotransferase (APT) family kinase protein
MAIGSSLEINRTAEVLTDWLARALPGASEIVVSDVRKPDSGFSSETILFELGYQDDSGEHREQLVLRLEPETGMFRYYDLESQYRVIRALYDDARVPVPKLWGCETDRSVLGAQFLVMSCVSGRVPRDNPPYTASGWVSELRPGERATMVDNALKAMVSVHETDYRALGLGFLDRTEWGADVVERRITYWRRTLEWATNGESNPIAEAAIEWLQANRPTPTDEPVLVWGDARVGNMLFAEDLSVAAVLDWEIQTIGTPEMDLGWWLFMQRHHTDVIGIPLPDGMPDRTQLIERYEELAGRSLQDIRFYEVLAATGIAALYHRTGDIMMRSGMLPPDAPIKLNNPGTQVLAEMLNLPIPEGTAQSYLDGA